MKTIKLNTEVSNADYTKLKNIYTLEELEHYVKRYLKDTLSVSSPATQDRILAESKALMKKLSELNLDEL